MAEDSPLDGILPETESDSNCDDAIDWWSILSDKTFLENPYSELRRLQAKGPVHFDRKNGIYFVLGHKAFARVSKSSAMGRDTRNWTGGWNSEDYRQHDPVGYMLFSEFQPQMINSDGEEHKRMRKVYEPAFRAQAMSQLEPLIADQASRLLAAMPDKGEIDFIEAFAAPLPLRVLCELFDIPESLDDTISRWSASLIRIGDILMTPEQKSEAMEALAEFKDFLRQQIKERENNNEDNLMGLAIQAQKNGTLDEEETLTNLVSMLVAGHETTVTLIGNGMLLLLSNPDELARLRSDPGLTRTAIEEFLRMEPGGNMILRVAREDFDVEGVTIPKGAPVIGLIGAINRDPGRFENADVLDIARPANAQFTFGGGAHFCIGAPLARLEAQIAFSRFLEKYPQIELAGEPEWRLDRMNARGLGRLPVKVKAVA
ncbi:cytochrome P450 [Roseibium album]|uniref:Biotin biosynthesis cytochrome P450 n=1 Tax=Roseibium album TaxID=311410 RepID=A0A0M7AJP8_9HYPH|nr:cytochrome P450 [Roseibium album]MBG6158715.1 cytochrome P450 [Labrenzia sp. EL_162]MBG6197249.1 cytochrome P450 [Labrenzia sp. EL_159]CTQ60455.1 Biotin biosynthesis cytochrome P450 [Roseibium album]CTQ66084.1 Biotin biosynthesis cytochrome P450 [Roseibium album]CTQ74003.1 Biotin biosynthesis cytochrome P450 [Roseibium album]